jgi:MFS transporter, PPP family, 3-phenylpropionic acid transporter
MLENTLIKSKYIFIYAAMVWLAYFAVYLEDQGFTGSQIGILYGVYQTTLFFIVIVWGFLSDRYGVRRIFLLVTAVGACLLYFLPHISGFYVLVVYVFLTSVFVQPGPPLLEGISLHYSIARQKGTFGSYRMFGAVGWGIAAPLLGKLIDNNNSGIIFPYATILILFVSLMAFVLLKLDKQVISGSRIKIQGIGHFFHGPFLFFLIIILLFGFCMAPISHVISMYYREIGASNVLIGMAFTIQTIVEIPFFFFGIYFVKKFGAPKTILLSILFGAVRLFYYGMITNPITALFGGILQGITLSLFIIAVVEYIQKNTAPEWRSTGQTIMWAFHFGAGYALGNFWLGLIKHLFSMNEIMIIQSIINLFVFILAFLYFRINPLHKSSISLERNRS